AKRVAAVVLLGLFGVWRGEGGGGGQGPAPGLGKRTFSPQPAASLALREVRFRYPPHTPARRKRTAPVPAAATGGTVWPAGAPPPLLPSQQPRLSSRGAGGVVGIDRAAAPTGGRPAPPRDRARRSEGRSPRARAGRRAWRRCWTDETASRLVR